MNWLLPAKGALICTLRIHIVRLRSCARSAGATAGCLAGRTESNSSAFDFRFLIRRFSSALSKNKISQNPDHQKSPLGS